MKVQNIIIFSLFVLLACKEEDTPPNLNQYEPFVTVGFYDSNDAEVVTTIDQVNAVGFNSFEFETAQAQYQFPLDINSNKSDFEIIISGISGNLTVEYTPRVENQVNVLRFILENTIVTNHSYDSVKVVCESKCNSNETEIKIYR